MVNCKDVGISHVTRVELGLVCRHCASKTERSRGKFPTRQTARVKNRTWDLGILTTEWEIR
jgi:hypothetical protein